MSKTLLAFIALTVAATPALAQESATLKRIAATKTLTVAYRDAAPPLSYVGPDGKPKGYSIDICMKIADVIKDELKLDKLDIKFLAVTAQTRIPLIANGTADIECAATSITLGRQKQVDFLYPTFVTGSRFLVKKGTKIEKLEDLNGKVLITLLGTTSERTITAEIERLKLKVEVVRMRDNPQAMLSLEQGRGDTFFSDMILLGGLQASARDPSQYEIVGPPLHHEVFGFIVPRNDADFRLMGNKAISRLFGSGEINEIYDRWFYPGPTNINLPMSDLLKAEIKLMTLPE